MTSNIFLFLNDLSPLWWVALAFVLGGFEMVTASFFLIWPGIAALIVAGILTVIPSLSGTAQILWFALCSVVLTFGGRSLMRRYGDGGAAADGLNERSKQTIGRMGKVIEVKNSTEGSVEIDGIHWHARWDGQAPAAGDEVRIIDSNSMTVTAQIVG
jgi:membrane protein implicated in regulation of membrane protease activity